MATKEALFKRRCEYSPIYSVCACADETVEHSLSLCDWAVRVWFCGPLSIIIDPSKVTCFHDRCENLMSLLPVNG